MRQLDRLLLQSGQRLLRLPFRQEADRRIDDNDDENRDPFDGLAHRKRNHGGHNQQRHDDALKLSHQDGPRRPLTSLNQSIRPVLREPPCGLDHSQSQRVIRLQPLESLSQRQRVPRFRVRRSAPLLLGSRGCVGFLRRRCRCHL